MLGSLNNRKAVKARGDECDIGKGENDYFYDAMFGIYKDSNISKPAKGKCDLCHNLEICLSPTR